MKQYLNALMTLILTAALLCFSTTAFAQARRGTLNDVRLYHTDRGAVLDIGFSMPVRYLRHAPLDQAEEIVIEIEPISRVQSDEEGLFERETVGFSQDEASPVLAVSYEGDATGGTLLSVEFKEKRNFTLEQGRDYRSIVIRVGEIVPDESK